MEKFRQSRQHPRNVQKTDKKLNLRPEKLVVTVPEKESGATAPAKSHKKNKNSNIVET